MSACKRTFIRLEPDVETLVNRYLSNYPGPKPSLTKTVNYLVGKALENQKPAKKGKN